MGGSGIQDMNGGRPRKGYGGGSEGIEYRGWRKGRGHEGERKRNKMRGVTE